MENRTNRSWYSYVYLSRTLVGFKSIYYSNFINTYARNFLPGFKKNTKMKQGLKK